MKRLMVIAFCIAASLVFVGGAIAATACSKADMASDQVSGVTLEQARQIALAKVPGEVEDEYSDENDDGDITGYVFSIRKADGKLYEVQVDAASGKVTSVEEVEEDDDEDDDEDPPAYENTQ